MKKYAGLLAVPFLLGSCIANAVIVTEEYTGSQDVDEGDSYTFDFDLWNTNTGSVNDNAPGLRLTTDGRNASGAWLSGSLYIDLWSSDADREVATIDLDAWTFRIWGAPIGSANVLLDTISFSRPSAGSNFLYANYNLTASQLNLLDNYGGGSVRVTATNTRNLTNDFTIRRVGLTVNTASPGSPNHSVPEPGTLTLLGAGLFGLALRRRRTNVQAA